MNNDPLEYTNSFKIWDIVQLKEEFSDTYGMGVLGEGDDQTNMATVVSLDQLQNGSILINPTTGTIDKDILVQSGNTFSIYPSHVLELFDDENQSNEPSTEGGRHKRIIKKTKKSKKNKSKSKKTKRKLRSYRARK
jgi:hypothetical protein